MGNSRVRRDVVWQQMLCAGLVVLLPLAAAAKPVRIFGGFESRFTDNARKSAFEEESDLESEVSVGIQHTSDPGRCNSDLDARIAYVYWLDDTFDPEPYGDMDFLGDCRIGRGLVWRAENYLREVVQDSRVSNNPDNRTSKNLFRTGPEWTVRLGSVDQVVFAAEYENTEYDEPEETDSERYIGTVSWNHFFDPSFTGGLSATADQAELDTDEEIDRETLSATFSKTWAATSLAGAVGFSQIETVSDSRTGETDGFVGNIELVRAINPTTELTLEASRELTDVTSDFDIRFDEFVFNLEQTSAVEVSLARGELLKTFSAGSTLALGAYASRSDYIDVGLEEDRAGFVADYRRPVTSQMTATFLYAFDSLSYSDDDTRDSVIRLNAGIEYQLNRQLVFAGRIGHEQRQSEIDAREFDENWVSFGLNYQFR
ncbi:MAG: outer membrane beta-barrel protein [Marinobacter sp.]|nr:outer membrane beta-barrel protein [Marinobacter sp.]